MKLILTSPDAIYDFKTNKYFENVVAHLDHFLQLEEQNSIAVVSIHPSRLKIIPKRFNPLHIENRLRGSKEIIKRINKNLGFEYKDIIVLASDQYDFFQAFNSKLLLLNAKYSLINDPKNKFLNGDYGIGLASPDGLALFLERLYPIENPWFYKLQVSPNTTVYSLINANTFYRSDDLSELAKKFRECLKDGKSEYLIPFRNYFLVSLYTIFKEIESIDYWSGYPSSSGGINDDLEYFVNTARIITKNAIKEPIFIRHTPSIKRHEKWGPDKRIKDGCDSQLKSIHLNPYYKDKLKGKTVCIIDDFTTYGTSCETARALLTSAGVEKIIFITLGRFGKDFYKYTYTLEGDIFGKYNFEQTRLARKNGEFNNLSNSELLNSIQGLI